MAPIERSRHRRKAKLRRLWRQERQSTGRPTSVHDVPDHLLELVLLRVGTSLSLIRAASTCKRWRRLVADAGFLGRFRSLHAPHVPGHYHAVDPRFAEDDEPPPAFLPDDGALGGRLFSLNFLPDDPSSWELADTHGGLLLFHKKCRSYSGELYFPDVVVCEPLTRRCQGILSPNEQSCLGVFLADGDTADETGSCVGMSNFRVISAVYDYYEEGEDDDDGHAAPRACIFSLGNDGGWDLSESLTGADIVLPASEGITFIGRVGCSVYWGIGRDDAVLAMDKTTAKFSLLMFPAFVGESYSASTIRVIGGVDGTVRIVRLFDDDLKVFARLQGGGGEWVVEKFVSLPEATHGLPGREDAYFQRSSIILAANERYILMTTQKKYPWLFSVELETLEVEREHERNKCAGETFPYELPWPPVMQACTAYRRRRRRRRRC